MSICTPVLLSLALSPSLPGLDCDPPPHDKFKDARVAVGGESAAQLETARQEMLTWIGDNVDPMLASEMDSLTDPVTGCVSVVTVWNGRGVSNAGCIAITPHVSLYMRSIIFIHEYTHCTRARTTGDTATGGSFTRDPETTDEPPGSNPDADCNHASMGVDIDLRNIAATCFTLSAKDRAELCSVFFPSILKDIDKKLAECLDAGGSVAGYVGPPFPPTAVALMGQLGVDFECCLPPWVY